MICKYYERGWNCEKQKLKIISNKINNSQKNEDQI
jgi:hypothetical protein